MYHRAWHILVVVTLLAASLSVPGCYYSDEEGNTVAQAGNPQGSTPAAGEEENIVLPPLPDEPEKGHPKLGGHLNQLISANERGEAEEFARSSGIDLVDGSVRVTIECVPGQVEAGAKEAAALGIVEIISRRFNGVQALVPITSLTALVEAESIRFVRLPLRPETEPD